MTPERLRQVEELYHAACEDADVLAGADPELRIEVEALLAHDGVSLPSLAVGGALSGLLKETRTELKPGDQLGPYRVISKIGEGGMGAVYLATHLGTTRTVALKVIIPEYAARDEFLVRFQREAAAAGRLRHPNVVNVTDFGITDHSGKRIAYLVMEYLDGQTLADYQKQHGRMPLDQVLDVVEQTALALDAAHAAGIVHRDLKPANIWMESNRRGGYNVKVLDFGIAKMASGAGEPSPEVTTPMPGPVLAANVEPDRTITIAPPAAGTGEGPEIQTRVGAIIGTPAYMSPEQCLGMPVDYRADIYSLALIAYELVAGRLPFQGATAVELLTQQIKTPVPSPRQFDPEISKPVAAALMHGLEKNPADRPVSAGTLAALLRAVVEGEFNVLRKGKDTFQSYPSVFAPLWIATFVPLVPLLAALLPGLRAISNAKLLPDVWLVIGFYAIGVGAWLFCAQLFKAAATLLLLKVSAVGVFRPATPAVMRLLIAGLPSLLRTQVISLLDLHPASFWENQLWPVVWAVEGRTGRAAVERSKELSRAVPAVSLTLVPRFYSPALWSALFMPCLVALVPGGGLAALKQLLIGSGVFVWLSIFYFLIFSRLYVLYGTAFPFLYWFAASCRGECGMLALPAGGAGRERKNSVKLRPGLLMWWCSPLFLACLSVIGLSRKVPADFVAAVGEDRASQILRFIDAGQQVDTATIEGTALSAASRYGDITLMKALLDRGAQPDKQQNGGDTPLMAAASYHHEDAAELLISRGANVNLRNRAGRTALMIAAIHGDARIAATLVQHGADLKVRDGYGKSALDYARDEQHTEIVALLNR